MASIPLFLNVKPVNVVMLPLVGKQNVLKSLPHSFTWALMPNRDIDHQENLYQ